MSKFNCVHISDVHFRGLKRHDEYKKVFVNLFEKARELKPNIIFIGGDIVHSKTQGISPELIDILTWWFNSLADIAPTHVILGNHDGLILNDDRQDAISPIINAIDNKDIYLYKKSGVYPTGISGFNWCVFSCFDEENWSSVEPIDNEINIACFHGGVLGSVTDTDWDISGEVSLGFFNNYDFGFLGDIHKLQYLDDEKRIAYPGSTIQQNYGEDVSKGFLFWEINSKFDYKSSFYKIENPHPYVTLDWRGDINETILFAKQIKKNCKIRVRSNENITQAEIKVLHKFLKEELKTKEIVYQNNSKKNQADISQKIATKVNYNIKNDNDRLKLLNDYFDEINDQEIDKVNSVYKKYLDNVSKDYSINNSKWSINSLKFDNTFGYGKDNYINFNNLNGIVGIFGNNRCGKSSIPGTLMYGLFNTTDRGSIKNEYVVNTRKGSCEATINITSDDNDYEITRSTVKKTNKNNKISTNTSLKLINKTNSFNVDESEEQRRETEKVLREIIGTSEEFLCTTFAAQGEINSFIKEKTTSRKKILSKFLNLDIYDELYSLSRDEYTSMKLSLRELSGKNWKVLIEDNKNNIETKKSDNVKLEKEILELKDLQLSKKLDLEKLKDNSNLLSYEKISQEVKVLNNKVLKLEKTIIEDNNALEEFNSKIEKINSFKSSFPLEQLKKDNEKLKTLQSQLSNLKNKLNITNRDKSNASNKLKILNEVPCGDQFKQCKFIKDAHNAKGNIDNINETINILDGSILEVKSVIKSLNKESIDTNLKKYDDLIKKEYRFKSDVKSLNNRIANNNSLLEETSMLLRDKKTIAESIIDSNNDNIIKEISKIETALNRINSDLHDLDFKNKSNIKNIFKLEADIEVLEKEENKYNSLVEKWKTLDLFSKSLSKKDGIPTMLINSSLPNINKEISEILHGVCNFKIELSEEDNGSLNIYIDYGDSKRLIECCSGMEKMMASLAIRVALINVSNLPKSDVFIIDEGFGSLDSTNIEACGRLLQSLKKYFKSILIISHVDAIKDIVDTSIVIKSNNKDSHVRHN